MMKKLLFTFLISLVSVSSFASHTYGGEMGWNCLPNGKYQFYMSFYRDCSGIQFRFQEETIEIVGNPLPTDGAGATISAIIMKPDSNRWENNRQGNLDPTCTSLYGDSMACANSDNGILQEFFWISDPITLAGIPPNSGWRFFWGAQCCRPGDLANVNSAGGQLLIRAVMFPTKQRNNVDPCIDSSPEFVARPRSIFCRSENSLFRRYVSYNNSAIDRDNRSYSNYDSLSFHLAYPINPPILSPEKLSYKEGYNYYNPTPNREIDGRNSPSILNELSGHINFAIFNGNGIEKYIGVYQVNSWREGKLIASVFREYPMIIRDCPTLPSGEINQVPIIRLDGKYNNQIEIEAVAGEKISIPIQITDMDSLGINLEKQNITFRPLGQNFAADYQDTNLCGLPPCAILRDTMPQYDSVFAGYQIKAQEEIITHFEWQTDSSNLTNKDSRIFNFYFYIQDDHCPVPGITSATISVRLFKKYDISKTQAITTCLEKGSNNYTLYWNKNTVRQEGFEKWYIYRSSLMNSMYFLIDSIADYKVESYTDLKSDTSSLSYYYMQAKGSKNGNNQLSLPSDTISTKNITAPPILSYNGECINMEWNSMKTSYLANEENVYYVYREIDLDGNFHLIDSVWNTNQYCDDTEFCGETIRYYIDHMGSNKRCEYEIDTGLIYIPNQTFNNEVNYKKDTIGSGSGSIIRRYLYTVQQAGVSYQWYNCNKNSIIFNQTSNRYFLHDTGLYALIQKKRGCADTSECIPFYPVGLTELSFKNQIRYFPNPTNGNLKIISTLPQEELQLHIRNIHGQLLEEQSFKGKKELDIEIIGKAGIYFIQLVNGKGEKANFKVVKQ